MWSGSSQRTIINDANIFDLKLETNMRLSSQSIIYKFMDSPFVDSPYGVFNTVRNEVRVFVDKQNRNSLFFDVKIYKEGERVVTLDIDSRSSPYTFLLISPDVNLPEGQIEGQMTHVPGSSINIETNLVGGTKINAQRDDNNKGGRDIKILIEMAGKQMVKVDISTEKTVNDNEIRLVLRDTVEVDDILLVLVSGFPRGIVSRLLFILLNFTKRTGPGEYEFYLNKNARNVLLNKFYLKAEVKGVGYRRNDTVMKVLLTTNEKPYKMSLYWPALLSDSDTYEVSLHHNPGQSLEIEFNHKTPDGYQGPMGFRIATTGSGNETELYFDGKNLRSYEATKVYELTDKYFKIKLEADGNWIEAKISLQGRLPNNASETEAFFLKNGLKAEVKDFNTRLQQRRHFNASLDWTMDKTRGNFGLKFHIAGEGPQWGTYTISRDLTAAMDNTVGQAGLHLAVSGDASFTKGVFANISPVTTDVDLTYMKSDRDLVGRFSQVIKGKEYSIAFPPGSFMMPNITWGNTEILKWKN